MTLIPRIKGGRVRLMAALAAGVLAAGYGGVTLAQPKLLSPPLAADGQPMSFADLVEKVSPAVVSVRTEQEITEADVPEQFQQFFQKRFGDDFQFGFPQRPRKAEAEGSGFFIDNEGHIVTNNHVVEGADDIKVMLSDGRELKAELIGTDPGTDLAVLKVSADRDQPYVKFAPNTDLRVGDWVVAVGNPFGLGGTVTAGIVSALGRGRDVHASNYIDFIQIDAPINRGNSGGPTFDLKGRVVGVNTAIISPDGGSVGIGFAIPADTAHDITQQLIDKGSVTRGWLGVSVQDVQPEIAAAMGLKKTEGALIADVLDSGPAQKAGFKSGDVVLSVDGREISDARDLTQKVGSLDPGREAKMKVWRDGSVKLLSVKLGTRDADVDKPASSLGASAGAKDMMAKDFGLKVQTITDAAREQFRIPDGVKGVVVSAVDPDGKAAEAGLAPGMVILQADNKDVSTPDDLTKLVEAAKKAGKDAVLLRFQVQDQRGFRALSLSSK